MLGLWVRGAGSCSAPHQILQWWFWEEALEWECSQVQSSVCCLPWLWAVGGMWVAIAGHWSRAACLMVGCVMRTDACLCVPQLFMGSPSGIWEHKLLALWL